VEELKMINRPWKDATVLAASVAALLVTACTKAGQPIEPGSGTAKSADGVPISYEVHGHGPTTLVFVHGWSCDRTYWRRQIDAFSRDHRVVALDLAGHGASGTGRAAWSIPNFANDVAAVIRALEVRNVVLIGHSLGGPVVVEAGLLLPDRVSGVIGVEAFFDGWSDPGFTKVVDQLRPNFAAGTRAFVRKALFLPTSPAALADSISDSMAAAPPEIALPAIDSMLAWARDRQDAAVSALRAPIGLIMMAGGRTATARFQRSRGTQPTIGIDEMPGAGHFLMLEIPDAFNAQLRVMLSRIRTPGST
jgi:pimeloyl-ACP methyl ester carboxylesterase